MVRQELLLAAASRAARPRECRSTAAGAARRRSRAWRSSPAADRAHRRNAALSRRIGARARRDGRVGGHARGLSRDPTDRGHADPVDGARGARGAYRSAARGPKEPPADGRRHRAGRSAGTVAAGHRY